MTTVAPPEPEAAPSAGVRASGVRSLRRSGDARVLLRSSYLFRVACGVEIVAVLLSVRAGYGLAAAGLAVGVFTAADAASQFLLPQVGARFGIVRMLRSSALLSALFAVAAFVVLTGHGPFPVLVIAVAALGASTPPSGSVIRALVPRVTDDEAEQDAAYRVDVLGTEIGECVGPVVAGLLVAVGLPGLAVLVAGLSAAGSGLLLTGLCSRLPDPPKAETVRSRPLRVRAVRVALVAAVAVSAGMATVQLAVVSGRDHPVPVPLVLALFAAGGIVGGLLPSRFTLPVPAQALLSAFSLVLVAVAAAVGPVAVCVAVPFVAAATTRLQVSVFGQIGRAVETVAERAAAGGVLSAGGLSGFAAGSVLSAAALGAGVPAAALPVLPAVALAVLAAFAAAPRRTPAGV